jgi:hypothetical protein
VLCPDVLVGKIVCLFGSENEDLFSVRVHWNFDRRRDALARRDEPLNFLAESSGEVERANYTEHPRMVFAHKSEQDVFGLDERASLVAGFVAGEEDQAASFFGVALEHGRENDSIPSVSLGAMARAEGRSARAERVADLRSGLCPVDRSPALRSAATAADSLPCFRETVVVAKFFSGANFPQAKEPQAAPKFL